MNLLLYISDRMVFGMSHKAGIVWVLSLDRYEVKWFLCSSLHFVLPDSSVTTYGLETSG